MLNIKIKKIKGYTAKSVMTGLCYAQRAVAADLTANDSIAGPHERILALHAAQLSDKFNGIAAKEQNQYTIKLTEVEAEAFRQIWGRLVLDYKAYGAVQVQNLLNEINRQL